MVSTFEGSRSHEKLEVELAIRLEVLCYFFSIDPHVVELVGKDERVGSDFVDGEPRVALAEVELHGLEVSVFAHVDLKALHAQHLISLNNLTQPLCLLPVLFGFLAGLQENKPVFGEVTQKRIHFFLAGDTLVVGLFFLSLHRL